MKEIIQKIMKNSAIIGCRNEENMVAERENIQVTEEKELLQQRTQGSRNEMEIVFGRGLLVMKALPEWRWRLSLPI